MTIYNFEYPALGINELKELNELKEAFFSLQTNKSAGHDKISFHVIKNCFQSLTKTLLHVFRLFFEKRVVSDDLKIAKFTSIFKASDANDFSNYRPISVLTCFSTIFKAGDENEFSNYRQISVLLFFLQYLKAGDANDFGNYKPLFVLSIFSKILNSDLYNNT